LLAVLQKSQLDDLEGAEQSYREAIRRAPLWSVPPGNLAILLQAQGRTDEAESAYRSSVSLSDGAEARNGLAWHLHLYGDGDEALELARQAGREEPESPTIAHTLACCLVAAGLWREAVAPTRTFVVDADDAFHLSSWDDIVHFFRLAHRQGHSADAVALLDEWGITERWLPLRTALQAAAVGDRDVLLSVAPEVRQPASVLLDQITAPRP
jgi:tetratricopeptide (TPR) repeat protein